MKNTAEKRKVSYLISMMKITLLVVIFFRPFFDGFSSPTFNLASDLIFSGLLVLVILKFYKKLDFSYAQISFWLFVLLCLFFIPLWPLRYKTLNEFSYLLSLLSVWILFKTVFNEENLHTVVQTMIFGLLIIIVYGIHQYFWGLESTRQMLMQNPEMMKNISETYLDRIASNRIFSTFVYPNTFAGYLLILYPVVFFVTFSVKVKRILRIINGLILAMIMPVFAATESMGGWFCFLAVSMLMLLFLLVPGRHYIYACIILLLMSAFLIYFGVKTGLIPKIGSLTDRINYWKAAFDIFKNHPVIGVGPGNFSQFYLQFKVPGAMEARFAHNLFFEVLTSTGIAGCFLFFSAIFFFVKQNLKKFLSSGNYLIAGFVFGIIGFFLHSLVDFDYADAAITTIIMSFAGLIECTSLPEKNRFGGLTKLIAGSIIILIVFATVIELKAWRVGRIIESVKTGKIQGNPILVLEKATLIFPEPEIFFIQGEIFKYFYYETKDTDFLEKAIAAYRKAAEINAFSPKYHRTLAMLLTEIKRYEEAEKEFIKTLEKYPTKALYNFELGLFYSKTGKTDLAKIYLEKGEKLPPSSKDEIKLIEEYKSGKSF